MSHIKPGVHEGFEDQDIISNLIETARGLVANDIVQSKDFFNKALTLSRNVNFHSGMGDCQYELGRIYTYQKNYPQAISSFIDATSSYNLAHNYTSAFESTFALAETYLKLGSYDLACEALFDALEISGKNNDPSLPGMILNKLGDISRLTGNFDQAISYHHQALNIFEECGSREMQSVTCYLIGNCMNWVNKLDHASSFLDRSLNIAGEIKDPELEIRPTGSMAILFTKLKEYDKAETYFYKALDLSGISSDSVLKADLLKNLGQLYLVTERYDQAEEVLNRSLMAIEESQVKYPSNQIYKLLAEVSEKRGDFRTALDHYKKYASLANEIYNEEIIVKTQSIQLRHHLEKVMKEKKVAEAAVALKDQFISNLSHEIRTPLNGVLGMATLLADTNPTPEQSEYINTIRLSANNLIETIDNILDFSRIQKGDVKIINKEFHLRELVASVIQSLKPRAVEKGLNIIFRFDEHIPDKVRGDEYRLSQILRNIISNAVKFTEKGIVQIDVGMAEAGTDQIKIIFGITDTGIGITEERLPHIFEIYSQPLAGDAQIPAGTGIGLAVVKQLTELQGGTISVNSALGSGSIFKIELPFKTSEPVKISKAGSKKSSSNQLKDLSQVTILLVEDNKVNQFLAQKLLGKMGFKVEIANNGKEALSLLKSRKFNLILMDVQMPEMNGYELTQMIRSTLPDPVNQIPVIALTAYASIQEKEKAFSMGMTDYITKPYSPHELLAAVMRNVNEEKDSARFNEESISEDQIRVSTDKLLQLFNGNNDDVISLFHMLASQIPTIIEETGNYVQARNWQATFHAVHRLKSSLQLLKIGSLNKKINELEEWSRDEINIEKIIPLFEEFRRDSELATNLLRAEIIRLKNSRA